MLIESVLLFVRILTSNGMVKLVEDLVHVIVIEQTEVGKSQCSTESYFHEQKIISNITHSQVSS